MKLHLSQRWKDLYLAPPFPKVERFIFGSTFPKGGKG